jgi:hypothetical protein
MDQSLPPRVIVVMPSQWPRVNLRAALREAGYDAIGTRSLEGALAHPPHMPDRGPVGAVVVDGSSVITSGQGAKDIDVLTVLRRRFGPIPLLLLASRVRADPTGDWDRIIRRPFSIQDAVNALAEVIPLPIDRRRPLDADTGR